MIKNISSIINEGINKREISIKRRLVSKLIENKDGEYQTPPQKGVYGIVFTLKLGSLKWVYDTTHSERPRYF